MKGNLILGTVFALVAFLFVATAFAQTPPQRSVTLNWSLPITATDGSALTGVQALTKIQLFLGTATIPTTATPTVELASGTVITTTQSFNVPIGGSLFARVKACNAVGCSDFSTELKKDFPGNVPMPPTNFTVTINLGP